jgi:hypothetical protein
LPDGRQLLFSVSPVFDRQQRRPDCTPGSTQEMVIGLKGCAYCGRKRSKSGEIFERDWPLDFTFRSTSALLKLRRCQCVSSLPGPLTAASWKP